MVAAVSEVRKEEEGLMCRGIETRSTSCLIFNMLSLILPVRHPSRGVEQAV